tara:strand:+ start:2034 stop:2261 length:228 start_codon:yes stop_codon:yes gene_type:complete
MESIKDFIKRSPLYKPLQILNLYRMKLLSYRSNRSHIMGIEKRIDDLVKKNEKQYDDILNNLSGLHHYNTKKFSK